MKMSITQALAELKLLDARINKAIDKGCFCVGYMAGTKIGGSLTPAESEAKIKSEWDSVHDLITRRANIKTKIVASNAATIVNVGGSEMTVAEAIERKASIVYEVNLLAKLQRDFHEATAKVTLGNESAMQKAQNSLDIVLGKDGGKNPSKDDMATIYDPVFQRYEYKLQDPLDIAEKIEILERGIGNFEHNVDFALSTSNAITTIEVD